MFIAVESKVPLPRLDEKVLKFEIPIINMVFYIYICGISYIGYMFCVFIYGIYYVWYIFLIWYIS